MAKLDDFFYFSYQLSNKFHWTNQLWYFFSSSLQYLQIARKLPSYGSIKFSNATADYPYVNNLVNILIGNKELSIQSTTNDGKYQETKFKITRMRCWRVTTNYNVRFFLKHFVSCHSKKKKIPSSLEQNEENSSRSTADAGCNSNNDSQCPTMELSFEYLMAKNTLQWITISSEHAMLISVCLQSIVDELLNQKDGHDLRQNIDLVIYRFLLLFLFFFFFSLFISISFFSSFVDCLLFLTFFLLKKKRNNQVDDHRPNLYRC